jgi:hypothetical protein
MRHHDLTGLQPWRHHDGSSRRPSGNAMVLQPEACIVDVGSNMICTYPPLPEAWTRTNTSSRPCCLGVACKCLTSLTYGLVSRPTGSFLDLRACCLEEHQAGIRWRWRKRCVCSVPHQRLRPVSFVSFIHDLPSSSDHVENQLADRYLVLFVPPTIDLLRLHRDRRR